MTYTTLAATYFSKAQYSLSVCAGNVVKSISYYSCVLKTQQNFSVTVVYFVVCSVCVLLCRSHFINLYYYYFVQNVSVTIVRGFRDGTV